MLFPLHDHILKELSYYNLSLIELQASHFVFVLINCVLAFTLTKERGFEYLGQVNMLALTTILLLIPLLFLNIFFINEWLNTIYLVFTNAFILKEYIRRMDYAKVLLKKMVSEPESPFNYWFSILYVSIFILVLQNE